MDIDKALEMFSMLDTKPILTPEEERLLSEAVMVLESYDLMDSYGNLIRGDENE